MKFTIAQDDLAAMTGWAASALAPRPADPVTAGILITAAAGTIAVTGTCYDTTGRAHAVADVEADGTALVPGKFLAAMVGNLPKREPVTVDASPDAGVAVITCGPARWTMPMLPAAEYPVMPEMPPAAATMNATDFAEAVAAVACAASTDDTLPMLTCVAIEVAGDGLTLVATDRYRLHVARVAATLEGDPPEGPLLIPARVLAAYAKAADGKVTLGVGGTEDTPWVGLADGGRMLVIRPLAGDYPKWRNQVARVAGEQGQFTATLDADLTGKAADRCSLAAEKNTGMKLEFDGTGTASVAAAISDGPTGTETVPGVGYDGQAFTLRVNPKWLTDALAACGSPRAAITLTSPVKPFIVTPVPPGDGEDSGDDPAAPLDGPFTAVLVPIRPQQ